MIARVIYKTLGCKQNQFDTEGIRHLLGEAGLTTTASPEEADWFILNTCAVTDKAMAKARGEINRFRRLNPDGKIVVIGCGALHDADNFANADYVGQWPGELGSRETAAWNDEWNLVAGLQPPHGTIPPGRTRGMLRIQTGCDQFCAFCIVPHLRGTSRSLPLADVLKALEELKQQDVPEVVLTGTNIALWGRDLPQEKLLADLLGELVLRADNVRIRLSSLEPQLISPGFIDWCLGQSAICRHFHFALQSGSERVLKAMQRGLPAKKFYQSLQEIKKQHPDLSLGADILVGYPGETQDDFDRTCDLVRETPFSYLHVFPFSERRGTTAWGNPQVLPVAERLRRAKILREIDEQLREQFIRQNDGRTADVIILDGRTKDRIEGLTSNYLRGKIESIERPMKKRFTGLLSWKKSRLTIQTVDSESSDYPIKTCTG